MPAMSKLHIYYRHVHIKHEGRSRDPSKRRPEWFDYEKCFSNLLQTLDVSPLSVNVTLTVIYDGSQADFVQDFMNKYCAISRRYPTYIKTVEAGSNLKSWHVALDQARAAPIADADLIYFVENDYLHLPGWLEKVFELYVSGIRFDYLSLYDHMDKYFLPMYGDLTTKLFVTATQHWRTAPSTCGTFMLRRSTLLEDIGLWAMEVQDHFLFTELCQKRGRILLTPVPGLATHCMEGYLSPTIDWAGL
jgi:hypothetical protein